MDHDLGDVHHDALELEVRGELYEWRGPAPFRFIRVPDDASAEIADEAGRVSYGWGMVPATLTIGTTTWCTALWPKDGGYVIPVKDTVRRAEGLEVGDVADVHLRLGRS